MLLHPFAFGTPASAAASLGESGRPPADVDELAAPLGHPSRNAAGVEAVLGRARPPALRRRPSRRSGTAAGPDVEPARVHVLADVARGAALRTGPRRSGMTTTGSRRLSLAGGEAVGRGEVK